MISFSEVYYWAGVSAEDFQKELEYELQKMTIGISVGLVKQANNSSTYAKLVNPYVHFGEGIDFAPDDDGMYLTAPFFNSSSFWKRKYSSWLS